MEGSPVHWGIFSNISHQKKLETYQPINAIITDYREDVDYDSDDGTYDYTYFPIYTFEVDGRKYIVEDNIGSSSFPHIGERELILYNPEDPYQITHFGENSFHRTEDFIDEDSGEIFPINRTFIRELIVPIGCIDNYDEHEYLSIGNIIEYSFWAI